MIHELNKTLLKTYQTFSDFVELCTQLPKDGFLISDTRETDSFFGDAGSFDEMIERCYDGYNARGIAESRKEISNLVSVESSKDTLKHMGDALDVPTYLSGDMRCFWAEDGEHSAPKRIHITYSANCLGGVGSENFYNHGGAIAVICDALDSIGAQTKITCTFVNDRVLSGSAVQVIEVKDYNESIDIPRIGVTTHPSFFRRIGFRYFESLGEHLGKSWGTGVGSSLTGQRRKEIISEDEFADWLRIDEDEIVVDLPAANLGVFNDTESTAKWVSDAIDYINNKQSKHIQLWKM